MRISALSWISRWVGLGGVASYWNSSVVSSGISLFLMLGSTFTISSKTCWTFLPNLVREGVLVGKIVVRRLWSTQLEPKTECSSSTFTFNIHEGLVTRGPNFHKFTKG